MKVDSCVFRYRAKTELSKEEMHFLSSWETGIMTKKGDKRGEVKRAIVLDYPTE